MKLTYDDFVLFVDGDAGPIDIYRLAGAGFAPALHLSSDSSDFLSTPLLPGFQLAVADIFQE